MPAPPGNLRPSCEDELYGNYLSPAHPGLFLQINLSDLSVPNSQQWRGTGSIPTLTLSIPHSVSLGNRPSPIPMPSVLTLPRPDMFSRSERSEPHFSFHTIDTTRKSFSEHPTPPPTHPGVGYTRPGDVPPHLSLAVTAEMGHAGRGGPPGFRTPVRAGIPAPPGRCTFVLASLNPIPIGLTNLAPKYPPL